MEVQEDQEKFVKRMGDRGDHCVSSISMQVQKWATQNCMDSLPSRSYEAMKRQATNGGRKNRSRPGNLREQIDPLMCKAYEDAREESNQYSQMWSTPQARDCKSADSAQSGNYQRKLEQGYTIDLNSQAHNCPTPTARDWKGSNAEEGLTRPGGGSRMDQLANAAVYSPLSQAIQYGQTSSENFPTSRQHLNPLFASWLMGWPSTWVIAEPHALSALETASFHCALQSQLSCLLGEQEFLEGARNA
jgi:hypothetical protein